MSSQWETFFEELSKIANTLLPESIFSSIHCTLKDLYRVLQKCPVKVENLLSLKLEDQNYFLQLLQSLLMILLDHDIPADSLLLGSTCLAILVAKMFFPQFSSTFLMSLSHSIGTKVPDTQNNSFEGSNSKVAYLKMEHLREIASHCIEQSTSSSNFIQEFTQERTKVPTFQQIALLHGILSYQKSDLFLFTSEQFKHKSFLVLMFNSIYMSCITPCSSQYHAFNLLVSWLQVSENLLNSLVFKNESNSAIFSSNTEIVNKILSVLASNWESPIKGVTAFVKECYRLLITVHNKECKILDTTDFKLVECLLEETMKLSWKVKGKYLVLSVVLHFVDCQKLLEKHLEVPFEIIFNLKANYAASIISEVYKTIVLAMKKSESSDWQSEWYRIWGPPIVKSLCVNDKSLIQNVTNLVLPWTMKTIPKSYEMILNSYEDKDIAPKLMLLRIAKESGICTLRKKEIKVISKYIHSHCVHLRMEILSILCYSPKKSEPLSSEELELLKVFIDANLNIDATPFQQQFLAHLRILLVRIRDSLVQECRLAKKDKDVQLSKHQIAFIDWLAYTAVKNVFPGACFQRRRLSLSSLYTLLDVFIGSQHGNRRKENPSKLVEKVIQVIQAQGSWSFFNDGLLLNVIPCITDFTDEIRKLTFDLIMDFVPWPIITGENDPYTPDIILKYAYSLCRHPDYRSNDGGAHLVCLIYRKLRIEGTSFSKLECRAFVFLNELVGMVLNKLQEIKDNLLHANPIHGYLLALQYCVSSSKDLFQHLFETQKEETLHLIQTNIDLCDDVIRCMLNVMKGGNNKSNCPSFSDIGQALEKLVVEKQNKSPTSCLGINELEEIQVIGDAHSPEIELLLSCCWHSIKNSCFLLCELASCISNLDMDSTKKKVFLKNIAAKLSTILVSCRHRGVVDACSIALNKFCSMLLKDNALHEEICIYLLSSVFDSLSDATVTSVTRRSAGLPSLVQAVVSSEQNNFKRKLLSFTMEKILICIYQPIQSLDEISDKTDLPQAHAYHILKVLVMDASLSQSILSHLDCIIPACVSGFSSSLWPIRNGALQLFGVLLPRICGQKKVRDDDSEHNLVSASELFARCPSLKSYLLQQLEISVKCHEEKKLCSELVPVLSILVKLSPPHIDDNDYGTEYKTLLLKLLDIPIWKVRDLVSSALSVLMKEDDVPNLIEELKAGIQKDCISCNKIHGILLVVQKYFRRSLKFSKKSGIIPYLVELYSILEIKKCSLLLGTLLSVILTVITASGDSSIIGDIGSLELYQTGQTWELGGVFYKNRFALLQMKSAGLVDIPKLLQQNIYNTSDADIVVECFQFLTSNLQLQHLETSFYTKDNLKIWKEICVIATSCMNKEKHSTVIQEVLKFMIELCKDWKVGLHILDANISKHIQDLLQYHLENDSGLTAAALSLTMMSLCIKSDLHRKTKSVYLDKWNMLLNVYCQPRSSDLLRMQASCSVAYLGPSLLKYLSEKIKDNCEVSSAILINLFEGSLLLLQDEDEEIRNKACEFPSNIPHKYDENSLQFNVGIKVLFQYMSESLQYDSNFLWYLWNKLQNFPSAAKVVHGLQTVESNPKTNLFEQEYVNVYAEPIKILLEYREIFKLVSTSLQNTNYTLWKELIEMFLFDLNTEVNDLFAILQNRIDSDLSNRFAYSHQSFLVLKRLHCQLEFLLDLKDSFCKDSNQYQSLNEILCQWEAIEKHLTPITCWFLHHL